MYEFVDHDEPVVGYYFYIRERIRVYRTLCARYIETLAARPLTRPDNGKADY